MPIKLFNQTIGLIQKSLDLRAFRHKLLSENIANSGTPRFQPKDIPFQKVLDRSIEGSSQLGLRRTHIGHLPGTSGEALEVEMGSGGVHIEEEMAKLAENNLMFQTGIQVLSKKFESLKVTILEGGR